MDDAHLLRYSRHILLDEIGVEGQQRWLDASVLIVGAGGLGSPAAIYLAAAGVGRIVLADGDVVDLTNLQRQTLHTADRIGQAKALSGKEALAAINPDVEVRTITTRLHGRALASAVSEVDVVLDCCDNFATRHAVNRACWQHGKPLVSGAAIRFSGQLTVFDPRRESAPCYNCLFPESDQAEELRCAVTGVYSPLTGIVGAAQAAEALKLLANAGQAVVGRLWLFDALSFEWRSVSYGRDPHCRVCGGGEE